MSIIGARVEEDSLFDIICPKTPWVNPFLAQCGPMLDEASNNPIDFGYITDDANRSTLGLDVEVYRNFFVACFLRFEDGAQEALELSGRCKLDRARLLHLISNNTLITFNGDAYDIPIIALVLTGASTEQLKEASNRILSGGVRPWEAAQALGVRLPRVDHIDLKEVCPAIRQSLKVIAGRLHARFMVDLPVDHEAELTPQQMNLVTLYCFNDLDATRLLHEALTGPLELRYRLGEQVGTDLRSRSDAQVGEAVVRRRIEALARRSVKKPNRTENISFCYQPPSFLRFENDRLTSILNWLRETPFHASGGTVTPPDALEDLHIPLGTSVYAMGIGGLHSQEAHRAIEADDKRTIIDLDITSQYPSIISKLELYPPGAGREFVSVYRTLINERLDAKRRGLRAEMDGLKISINGIFGKLGSLYSFLYDPAMMVATTLTGQLVMLMLIERCEASGIAVVSGNTDGIIVFLERRREGDLREIIARWEIETGLTTETTRYRAVYSSSVNTYIALKDGGGVKRKGWIADPWGVGDLRGMMSKNPQMTVCSNAVVSYVDEGRPIEDAVRSCTDLRQLVTVIKVTGGGYWRKHPLGRAVRYYWSTDGDHITYANGNRVSKTQGARPLVEMTDMVPEDVDWNRYVTEARRLAVDVGAMRGD